MDLLDAPEFVIHVTNFREGACQMCMENALHCADRTDQLLVFCGLQYWRVDDESLIASPMVVFKCCYKVNYK